MVLSQVNVDRWAFPDSPIECSLRGVLFHASGQPCPPESGTQGFILACQNSSTRSWPPMLRGIWTRVLYSSIYLLYIGYACAQRFLQEGAHVLMVDKDAKGVQAACREFQVGPPDRADQHELGTTSPLRPTGRYSMTASSLTNEN